MLAVGESPFQDLVEHLVGMNGEADGTEAIDEELGDRIIAAFQLVHGHLQQLEYGQTEKNPLDGQDVEQ